jgi:hypothetical protein
LVITPKVRNPLGSDFFAIIRESEVEISALAGQTANIIVYSSSIYLLAISFVIYSILALYPGKGILVIPGKSTKVRSGQLEE